MAQIDMQEFVDTIASSRQRFIEQAQESYHAAVEMFEKRDEIYADYAASTGKPSLSDDEKKQAILNYVLANNTEVING